MKVLIDVNLSPIWMSVFEKEGIEAIHWASVGESENLNLNWKKAH